MGPEITSTSDYEPSAACGFIRGTTRAGDSLRLLARVRSDAARARQNRWIIDNRQVRSALPLADVAEFSNEVRTQPQKFENLVIALVSRLPIGRVLQAELERLNVNLNVFYDMGEAYGWLLAQR
jgi:hypothetical protein